MVMGFKKITPHNGFDGENPDNGKQNNYAWAMEEMGDYIYVGTGRNIAYNFMKSGVVGQMNPPSGVTPEKVDNNPEIWRFKKDGTGEWERVYKAPQELGLWGIRFLIKYTTPSGEEALYAGGHSLGSNMVILKSNDGENWRVIGSNLTTGNTTRSMISYKGKLYMAVLNKDIVTSTLLYASSDPEKEPWRLVTQEGEPDKNPRGEISSMCSFNDHLYVGTANPGGFEIWRTEEDVPEQNKWKLVVDKGAGDALNEVPMTMSVFRESLFVGTAIALAVYSIDRKKRFNPPKGFDLIRVNPNDTWDLIIGGEPLSPTWPATGRRGYPLGYQRSGFNTITNAYCWQLQPYKGELYLGTFDWSAFALPGIAAKLGLDLDLDGINISSLLNTFAYASPMLRRLLPYVQQSMAQSRYTMGFDLWKSSDGVYWTPVTLNGLENTKNHGARNLLVTSEDKLYLGTANSFEGCEVWVYDGENWY